VLSNRCADSEAHMPMTQTEIDGFNASLKDALPRLRVYALSLTRDPDRADNLVQQTSLKALAGRESFRPGTNFGGWIFRIQRNEFISGLQRERPTVDIDYAHATLSTPPTQDSGLVMREFMTAFRQVSRDSRQALLLSTLAGQSCEQFAIHTGIAEGTVKSRVSRGRATLQRLLAGTDACPANITTARSPAIALSISQGGHASLETASPGDNDPLDVVYDHDAVLGYCSVIH